MRAAAAQRTRDLLLRVNDSLRPVELDFDKDVAPLTPKGNATERHLCDAFERKAVRVFPNAAARNAFALDTHLAWRMVSGFRKAWSLETREPGN